jgi:hypothetical protein
MLSKQIETFLTEAPGALIEQSLVGQRGLVVERH